LQGAAGGGLGGGLAVWWVACVCVLVEKGGGGVLQELCLLVNLWRAAASVPSTVSQAQPAA
jgi:hypothetical protein